MGQLERGASRLPEHVRARILQEQGMAQTDTVPRPAIAPRASERNPDNIPGSNAARTAQAPAVDLAILRSALGLLDDVQLQQVLTELPAHQLARALEQILNPGGANTDAAQSTKNLPQNMRKAERTQTRRVGKIIYNGNMSVSDCKICDLSETGCRISIESVLGIPNCFTLHIVNGNTRHECEVVWRKQKTMGLKFLD